MKFKVPLPYFLTLLLCMGCGANGKTHKDTTEPAAETGTPTDSGTETFICSGCLSEQIPSINDVLLTQYPGFEDNPCQGICIRKGSTTDGMCIAPEEPGKTCNYKAGTYSAEELDSELASEPFTILATEDCKDECDCNELTCTGQGDPLEKTTFIMVPAGGATRDELVVFLGGTGGNCNNHKWITSIAATAGYATVCLGYINDPSGLDYCTKAIIADPETTCGNDFRRENIYGEDHKEGLVIGPRNSIRGRLIALLTHVEGTIPSLKFGQYLKNGEPDWSKIVISGFSQGGGHAGILSQDYETARAVFFSKGISSTLYPTGDACDTLSDCPAEAEVCANNLCIRVEPSPYFTAPRATPSQRTYGILHELEDSSLYSPTAWDHWGMDYCSSPTSVETAPADFGCSHVLTTNAEPAKGEYHPSIGSDDCMAKDAQGYPVNQRAMMYMFVASDGASGTR
jgi:hypothetical protein